jgi:hypothetical protein
MSQIEIWLLAQDGWLDSAKAKLHLTTFSGTARASFLMSDGRWDLLSKTRRNQDVCKSTRRHLWRLLPLIGNSAAPTQGRGRMLVYDAKAGLDVDSFVEDDC